jgi:hypothetical protein
MHSEAPKELAPKPGPEPTPRPKAKSEPRRRLDDDMSRVFWERTRANRAVEALLVQNLLWLNLFFDRGAYTGLRTIIPWALFILIETFVLISVTRFGSLFDIIIALISSFSSLAATFSTLYWNYGTAANFTEGLTRLDAVYFTVGTLTTAGTGTISATSQVARGLQTLQMTLGIVLIVFAVSLVIAELSSRIQKRKAG